MKTINRENIDAILFDYFEGNLSSKEKYTIKYFIDNNPEYLDDFRLWEISNVGQIKATTEFDITLLKPTTNHFNWLKIILAITLLSTISILTFKAFQTDLKSTSIQTIITNKNNKPTKTTNTKTIENTIKTNHKITSSEKKESPSDTTVTHISKKPNLSVETKQTDSILSSKIISQPETNSNKLQPKILTKKEQRIEKRNVQRHIQKSTTKKEVNDFLKGNKPYVVNPNPSNF